MSDDAPRPYRHLFGPVASRRLGRSLGVDLAPMKTCSYDCVYCQLGRTTRHTTERREWVPTAEVIGEIRQWAAKDGEADVVTVAGSGEPTLHTGLGAVLDAIHECTRLPAVVLTNGSLLHLPEVRSDLARADIVKVTLSAAQPEEWKRIHRPSAGLSHAAALAGLAEFRAAFAGQIWIEIMVMGEINDREEALRPLAEIIRRVRPERVQLNTPVRPPAESFARPVPKKDLDALARLFDPPAEVIGEYHGPRLTGRAVSDDAIAAAVSRHPSSAEDLARIFDRPESEMAARLRDLAARGLIREMPQGGTTFYMAPDPPAGHGVQS